jgi:hypothetical protein
MRPRAVVLGLAVLGILAEGPCDEPIRPVQPARSVPPVSQNEPGAGDPPVVWIGGILEAVEQGQLALREGSQGQGPRIRVERLAEGATDFYQLEAEGWRELSPEEVDLIEVGDRACVEALLDGRTFLALRVFLDSSCGPSGPAG